MKTALLTIAVAVGLLLVAMVAMGIKALFVRNGRFPSGHICGMDADAGKNRRHNRQRKTGK